MIPPEAKSTILITGGAGFIGTHLGRAILKAGHSVRSLDISTALHAVSGIQYRTGDIRDVSTLTECMKGVSAVFHLAALVSVPLCQEDPVGSYSTNVSGTVQVLEAIRREQERSGHEIRLVYAGSSVVYGNLGKSGVSLTEAEIAPWPKSFYGAQKLASEQAIRLYTQTHRVSSLIFRFFNVFGPGQNPDSPYSGVISIFNTRLKHGQSLALHGGGHQTRDFIAVEDIAEACAKTLDLPRSAWTGAAINLGTGHPTTIRELAEIMRRERGNSLPLQTTPPREGDVEHSLADISTAKKILAWEPKITLKDGLSRIATPSGLG